LVITNGKKEKGEKAMPHMRKPRIRPIRKMGPKLAEETLRIQLLCAQDKEKRKVDDQMVLHHKIQNIPRAFKTIAISCIFHMSIFQ